MIFKQHNYRKVKAFFRSSAWKKTLTFLFFLFLSFGFWLLQALQQPFETEVSIPLQFQNVPPGIVMADNTPSEILVKIKGKGTLLLRYTLKTKRNEALEINLEDIDLKKSSYTVSKKNLESKIAGYFSFTTTLISCTPDVLNITCQPLKKKEVPIVLSGKLTPAIGYILIDSMLFTPSKIVAYGSKATLDSISAIYTENISITDIQSPIKKRIKLIAPKGINLAEASVELNVSAEEFTEKIIQAPIICKNLPENYKIHIFPPSVEIICPVALANYGKIKNDNFEASIDYFELLKSPNYTTTISLTKKPNGMNSYRLNPEKVEFLIEEKK